MQSLLSVTDALLEKLKISTPLNQRIKRLRQNHHIETLIHKMYVQRDLENILKTNNNILSRSKKK